MSDFEDLVRRAMSERAASVRTAPDPADVGRRIRRAERATARVQRATLVSALVVVAGSIGGVLGAVANRPAGVPVVSAAASGLPSGAAADHGTHEPARPGSTAAAAGGYQPAAAPAPAVHTASFGGVTVDWLMSDAAQPVEVVPGSGMAPTCSKIALVSLAVGDAGPVATGSAVVGLPALQPGGLAVIASGTFGATGRAPGWWAMLEAGSAAADVAVQFPSGAVVKAVVSAGGLAVVAGAAPAGTTLGGYSQYASAVADGPTRTMGSLEFLIGGGIAAVDAVDGSAGGGEAVSGCALAPSLAAAGAGTPDAGAAGLGRAPGPPGPLVAAGDVLAAYAQAYDVDPVLGLASSYSAVDLGSSLGCPVQSLAVTSSSPGDGLVVPSVQVEGVVFVSPTAAVVVYRRLGSATLETGTATLVDGVWKVGGATYCADMEAPAAPTSTVTTP